MKIHYIQHVPFEELGYMDMWLQQKGYKITCTKVWENAAFPDSTDYDGLLIMGGSMSAHDDDRYLWLKKEKRFISTAIQEGKKIIGICLGAQLLASVLKAPVYANTYKEIGWFPVTLYPSFLQWLGKEIPAEMTVFHWHGDTFDTPAGAINGAASAACRHQLFTYGDNVIGLQFHPEATPMSLRAMVENDGHELVPDVYVQTAEALLQHTSHCSTGNQLMKLILEKLFAE